MTLGRSYPDVVLPKEYTGVDSSEKGRTGNLRDNIRTVKE